MRRSRRPVIYFHTLVLVILPALATALVPSSLYAGDGDFVWSHALAGTTTWVHGNDIAIDSVGNVYTFGNFTGTVDFDPGPGTQNLTAAGNSDMFIHKMDGSGNLVWAKTCGGISGGVSPGAIAIDAADNLYITGIFDGTVDLDPGPGDSIVTGAGAIFVVKLDNSGNLVWAKIFGGSYTAYFPGVAPPEGKVIAVDPAGNVYITGFLQGTADFDPGPGTYNLTSTGGNLSDIFVSKLDSGGNFAWAKTMGGTSYDEGWGIAVDAAGNAYTTGYFSGTADFDPGPGTLDLTSAGPADIFVSKLDSSGNLVWAKAMGGSGSGDLGTAITLDSSGIVYITGRFEGTADFDPGPGTLNLTTEKTQEAFACKLDNSGNLVWAKAEYVGIIDISVDSSGNVYTTGGLWEPIDLDPGPGTLLLSSAGGMDIFLSKLDSNGNLLWGKAIGGPGWDYGCALELDPNGSPYTANDFTGTVDTDPGPGTSYLTSGANGDTFILKLANAAPVGHYTETVNASGTGAGTVYFSPPLESYSYPAQNTISISPIPNGMPLDVIAAAEINSTASWDNCEALGGTSSGNGTDTATCSFPAIDGDKVLNATFTYNASTVTVNASGTGAGAVYFSPPLESYNYPAQNSISISPIPNGMPLDVIAAAEINSTASWDNCEALGGTSSGNGTDTATCSFPAIDGDKVLNATFTYNASTVTVTATAGLGGSLDGSTPSPQVVDLGATVDFTFNADTGYHISSIEGCGIGITNDTVTTRSITVGPIIEDCTVTATFAIDKFVIEAFAGVGGTVDGGVYSSQVVDHGATAQFTFDADPYLFVASVSGCGINYSNSDPAVTTYTATTTPITGECTINATFGLPQVTVTAIAEPGGSLDATTPSPQVVTLGATVDFTFNADTGYHITSIEGCGIRIANDTVTSRTLSFGPIIEDCTVTATFAIDKFVIEAFAGAGGTVDGGVYSSQIVDYGTTAQFTFDADTGYHVVSITGCGINYLNDANTVTTRTVTTETVVSGCTVNATFIPNSYQLSLTVKGKGTVTSDTGEINCPGICQGKYNNNATVIMTARPDRGMKFIGWKGDTDCEDGMVTITGDVSCTAEFSGFPWSMFLPVLIRQGNQ